MMFPYFFLYLCAMKKILEYIGKNDTWLYLVMAVVLFVMLIIYW